MRRISDLAREAILEEALESAYRELGIQPGSLNEDRVRERFERKLKTPEAAQERILASSVEQRAATMLNERIHLSGRGRGLPETQRNCLIALYTLDPAGKGGVSSGAAYDAMERAGFKLNYTPKSRAGHVQGMFDGLVKRRLAKVDKVNGRRLAFITDEGREHVEKHEAPLVEQYAKANEGVERFF